jgi:hypothetical protein
LEDTDLVVDALDEAERNLVLGLAEGGDAVPAAKWSDINRQAKIGANEDASDRGAPFAVNVIEDVRPLLAAESYSVGIDN